MHGRIRIGLPKVHGRFPTGPPQVFHPICPLWISTVGEFRCTIAIMQEKRQNVLLEIKWILYSYGAVSLRLFLFVWQGKIILFV